MHIHYSELVADMPGAIGQRSLTEKDLSRLERMVQKSKKMLVQTFDEHCDTGLYTFKYHLSYLIVDIFEDLERYLF